MGAVRAFSLIEIMVAVSLLSVIIVGLVLTFNQVQRAVRSGTGQADVLEGGRAAMNLIARDLQELSTREDRSVTNFFTYRAWESTKQDLPSGGERENVLYDLFFVVQRSDEASVIAYRVDATNGGLAGPLMRLEMVFTNSTTTNQLVNDSRKPPYVLEEVLNDNTRGIRSWLNDPTNPDFHRVSGNVVHFNVVAYDHSGIAFSTPDSWRTNFYANYTETNSFSRFFAREEIVQYAGIDDVFHFTDPDLPAYVEVELGVLDSSTATKLQAREDASGQGAAYLQKQAGRVDLFRQRIAIRPAATIFRP